MCSYCTNKLESSLDTVILTIILIIIIMIIIMRTTSGSCSTKPWRALLSTAPHIRHLLLLSVGYYQKPTNHLSPWSPASPISWSLSCLIKTLTGHGDKKVELQFITLTYLTDWALVSSRPSTQHNQNSLWEGGSSLKDGWAHVTADFSRLSKDNYLQPPSPLLPLKTMGTVQESFHAWS